MKSRLRFHRLPGFLLYYVGAVLRANLRLVRDVLGRPDRLRPGIIEVPLEPGSSARQRWILATCVTMTPGTLCLEATPDVLRVHALHAGDPAALVRELKETLEERIRDVF